MSAACCGFGHRTLFTNIELELYQVIEKLITENGVDIFYTGGMGQFDEQFTNAVRKAKLKYNHISIVLIKPYFSNELNTNKEYYNYRYDDVMICEESELVHPKAAIKKRNRWMVDECDFVIGYIQRDYGGAYDAIQYARRMKKQVIMVGEK